MGMNPRRSSILKGFDHIGFESCFLTPKGTSAEVAAMLKLNEERREKDKEIAYPTW